MRVGGLVKNRLLDSKLAFMAAKGATMATKSSQLVVYTYVITTFTIVSNEWLTFYMKMSNNFNVKENV